MKTNKNDLLKLYPIYNNTRSINKTSPYPVLDDPANIFPSKAVEGGGSGRGISKEITQALSKQT